MLAAVGSMGRWLLVGLCFATVTQQADDQWQAGVAKVDITPTESVPLAGYGGPSRMSTASNIPSG